MGAVFAMTYTLRPYQREAVAAATSFIHKCFEPCVIEAATGAGKSLIVSEIALWLNQKSNKKVLCLAPSKELTEQNAEKYRSYGFSASLWSASVGRKEMLHDVVFGTPQSVLNSIEKFTSQYAAVIVDEAHRTTETIKKIICSIREHNPRLRVIGLTATPYRMGSGYIYQYDDENNPIAEDEARDPYYTKLVYKITAQDLIKQGFLTQPFADVALIDKYKTDHLVVNSRHQFDSEEVKLVFEGRGRLTSKIVADVVNNSVGSMGVMFFAATINHANEIMESLPPSAARMVTGDTKKKEREIIINQFKRREFKYLVNVSVLTTGFDAPHVDVIAILRATESAALLQQIIGRGLRLHEEKPACLVLDYAGNIERHGLEDDLFSPVISTAGGGKSSLKVKAVCPSCQVVNQFTLRKECNPDLVDKHGYALDLEGEKILIDGQYMPAHYGRRCFGGEVVDRHYERCEYRWSLKICPGCEGENDIAARHCNKCQCELIDPNKKLMIDYKKMKSDPRVKSTDAILAWRPQPWTSQRGNACLKVDYTTEYRTFSVWYNKKDALWKDLCRAVFCDGNIAPNPAKFCEVIKEGKGTMPKTITARKQGDFYIVYAHNEEEDKKPCGN